jgi:uncharacterized membrane protein SpoIIM required for sporulation
MAAVGAMAWGWRLVHTQFSIDERLSLGDRLDLVAGQIPTLLLAALVAGAEIGLRFVAWSRAATT